MAYDVKATEAYIRQSAQARGIDPDIAVRVARSEGLAGGVWQSNLSKNGRREPSYGPFQLLVGGEGTGYPTGMGNDFIKQTGLNPADPSTVNAQIDFALDRAASGGWGPWYGAAKVGVGKWDGLKGSQQQPSLLAQSAGAVNQANPAHASTGNVFTDVLQQQAARQGDTSFLQPKPAVGQDRGLVNMLLAEGPNNSSKFQSFMGGEGGPMSAANAGLSLLAAGSGGGSAPAPQIQAAPIDANTPDMSLLASLLPNVGKRRA